MNNKLTLTQGHITTRREIKCLFLPSVFFSLHTNNKVQQSPLGGKHPKIQQVQQIVFPLGSPRTFLNQCSDKKIQKLYLIHKKETIKQK